MSSGQRRKGAGCEGVACEHTLGEQPLHLYGYLWVKPPAAARANNSNSGGGGGQGDNHGDNEGDGDCGRFSAVVTDTVVFKHQKPSKWFFTSKQEKGKLLCKSKKSLSVGQVLQAFLEPKLYTRGTRRNESELILASFAYTERSAATGELQLVVEHLDKAGLTAVILTRDKPAMSVLQRFVPTKSGYNHMIQSVFTPESCIIRKCVNANLTSDANLSVTQRTITFEADEKDVRARAVTSKDLQQNIEQIHLEFSAHLEKIVGKEIVRNVAYLKIGADDRIYLLWSTMISFERPGKTFAKSHRLALSSAERHHQSANLQEISHSNKLLGLYSQLKCCPVCNEALPRSQVDFLITYKTIISHSENEVGNIRGRDGQAPVPAVILKICGPMKKKRFEQLKQDTTFLYQTVRLCQICAQKLTPRQVEAPPPPVKSDENRVAEAAVAVAPKEPDKSSAHSLFWGKVARGAKLKGGVAAPKARPFSTNILRARFQRKSSTSPHSSKQCQRHLSQLPPVVQGLTTSSQLGSTSQDHLEDIAQHLQRKYHRPSIRFALAQCNIFPAGSVVPASALCWICGPELVAAISSYWAELSKSRGGTTNPSTIDIDSFDGILMNRVRMQQEIVPQAGEAGEYNHGTATTCTMASSTHVPVRPSRPKISRASMSSSRTNSLTTRIVNGTADPLRAMVQSIDEQQVEFACDADESVGALREALTEIDVRECTVHDGAVRDNKINIPAPGSLAMRPEQENRQGSVGTVLQSSQKTGALLPSSHESPSTFVSSDDLAASIEVAVARSTEQHDKELFVHLLQPSSYENLYAHMEASCTELSEEELRVLEETLMKCG